MYCKPLSVVLTPCFVLFALQLSVCLWWHDYRRDGFPTLKFGVVMADLARHLLREEPFAGTAWLAEHGSDRVSHCVLALGLNCYIE